MKVTRSARPVVAAILGAALVVGAASSASADALSITKIYTSPVVDGYSTIAYTAPMDHAGKVTFTFFKKNASGDWVRIGEPVPGTKITAGVWNASLAEQKGDKDCKVRARYTAKNHDPATAVNKFNC